MANMCSNFCIVEGKEEDIKKLLAVLKTMEKVTNQYVTVPQGEFSSLESKWMDEVVITDSKGTDTLCFSFETRWTPGEPMVRELSKVYNVTIENSYMEMSNGIFGELKYKSGDKIYDVCLIDSEMNLFTDEEGNYHLPSGEIIESEVEYYEGILEDKLKSIKSKV